MQKYEFNYSLRYMIVKCIKWERKVVKRAKKDVDTVVSIKYNIAPLKRRNAGLCICSFDNKKSSSFLNRKNYFIEIERSMKWEQTLPKKS